MTFMLTSAVVLPALLDDQWDRLMDCAWWLLPYLQVIARGPWGTCLPVEVAQVEMTADDEAEKDGTSAGFLVFLTVSRDSRANSLAGVPKVS
jgi:hypothetical protein